MKTSLPGSATSGFDAAGREAADAVHDRARRRCSRRRRTGSARSSGRTRRPRSPRSLRRRSRTPCRNGVGSSAPFLTTRSLPPCSATKIRPSGAIPIAGRVRDAGCDRHVLALGGLRRRGRRGRGHRRRLRRDVDRAVVGGDAVRVGRRRGEPAVTERRRRRGPDLCAVPVDAVARDATVVASRPSRTGRPARTRSPRRSGWPASSAPACPAAAAPPPRRRAPGLSAGRERRL